MGDYQLSRQAENDLLTIYASTEEQFGKYQADAYHAGFERSFGLLADFPLMGHRLMNWLLGFAVFASNPITFSTPKILVVFLSVHSSTSE
jgi:plasmid stabilization system protein ParE